MESRPRSLSEYDPIFLLSCDEPFGRTSIDEVSQALLRSADPEGDIGALLREADWRCHLVAGVVLVVSELRTKPKLVEALWGAVDAGSWVSPQLGVCLAIIDPDFSLRAKTRIESGCPVVVRPSTTSAEVAARQLVEQAPAGLISRSAKAIAAFLKFKPKPMPPLGEQMARRHIEQGPDGSVARSAKTLAALLYLCSLRPECEPWLISCRADRSTQRLVALDLHHGGKIAEVWRTTFNRALSAFQSN
jgi:hypothetical protein